MQQGKKQHPLEHHYCLLSQREREYIYSVIVQYKRSILWKALSMEEIKGDGEKSVMMEK